MALKRALAAARAAKGMSWSQVADALAGRGLSVSPGNLMTKFSRWSFTAGELVALRGVLQPDDGFEGLDRQFSLLKRGEQ